MFSLLISLVPSAFATQTYGVPVVSSTATAQIVATPYTSTKLALNTGVTTELTTSVPSIPKSSILAMSTPSHIIASVNPIINETPTPSSTRTAIPIAAIKSSHIASIFTSTPSFDHGVGVSNTVKHNAYSVPASLETYGMLSSAQITKSSIFFVLAAIFNF